jgi:hypothetical protein
VGGTTEVHVRDDGTFEVEHHVQQLITVTGSIGPLDCAAVEGGCVVAAGDGFDLRESGGVPVTFEAPAPVPDPPEVVVTPDEGLRDGDEVDVEISGLAPRTYLTSVNVCALAEGGADFAGCEPVPAGERLQLADPEGRLRFSFVAHRRLEPLDISSPADCVEVSCVLVLSDDQHRVTVPLAFDPDVPAPPEATVEVDLPERVVAGTRVTIEAADFRADQDVIAYLCPAEAPDEPMPCGGAELGYATADEDGMASFRVRLSDEFQWFSLDGPDDGVPIDCTERPGRCDLVVTNFYRAILRVPLTFDG